MIDEYYYWDMLMDALDNLLPEQFEEFMNECLDDPDDKYLMIDENGIITIISEIKE